MPRKMKITIEYEMDDADATLESEREAWLSGDVDMHDIVSTDGKVAFEIVEG